MCVEYGDRDLLAMHTAFEIAWSSLKEVITGLLSYMLRAKQLINLPRR